MKTLHISPKTTHSGHKPSIFMSSFFSSPYISPLPSPPFYRPIPNHPHSFAPDARTTSICHTSPHAATLCIPKRLYKSTLHFLSFTDAPHIHLTIIRSVLSRVCSFLAFNAHVSVPYVNTLWTQSLYIFLFMWYDAPRAARIKNNSLNEISPGTSYIIRQDLIIYS